MKRAVNPVMKYFGGKFRLAKRLPAPKHDVVVEPFAGGAGYSLYYGVRKAILIEKNEKVAAVWDYLIRASPEEILALPLLSIGQPIDELDICQEAKWLLGFNVALAASPQLRLPNRKTFVFDPLGGDSVLWGAARRHKISQTSMYIKDWKIIHGTYRDAPDIKATWLIDPPYAGKAGAHYKYGPKTLDYTDLADFCRTRNGLTIVCEGAEHGNWLPFEQYALAHGTSCMLNAGKTKEFVWVNETE